ncbi:cytochrome c nitrite reductase subunit NrfD [Psychromonas sp. MB-3u-54]|uniref:cytochrome c nitrite reductase subunit NrfD n=1 Tax=Psychromonas sp. MB-3u-54 TaxID=2058319 RepID=UPI0018E2E554|nr:cytochrome c nitrite reductase subunit NrfD [Psychromonas sp. MB-3u-54]
MMESLQQALHFDSLVWHWPIAIYLFVLGISSGAMCLALFIKWKLPSAEKAAKNPLIKAAAILVPSMVIFGLVILVFDLTKPLHFWKVIVYQFANPTSVMGRGVTLFIVYQITTFAWIALVFRKELETLLARFMPWAMKILGILWLWDLIAKVERQLEFVIAILAVLLGVYTGFLLSALNSYPLLNQPVLPLLFLASGLSSGIAATILLATTFFSANAKTSGMTLSHRLEQPIVWSELALLIILIIGMNFGGEMDKVSIDAAISGGFWAGVFWVGVMGIGILLPLMMNQITSIKVKHSNAFILSSAVLTLVGVMSLRMFILYAGQMTPA